MEEAGMAAKGAHNRKVIKSLQECKDEGIHFVPLAWESIGGATETVHETIRKWTELEGVSCVFDSTQSVFADLVLPAAAFGSGCD